MGRDQGFWMIRLYSVHFFRWKYGSLCGFIVILYYPASVLADPTDPGYVPYAICY